MDRGFLLLSSIQALRQPWLDRVMVFFSALGDMGVLWIVLTLLLLLYKPTRRIGVVCALSLVFSLCACNLILKPFFHRLRPFQIRELELLVVPPTDASFPSGHASSSFAWAYCLLPRGWKAALPSYLAAALISFSRLYLQLHFPGDVIGGAALGTLCGVLASWLWNRVELVKAD